MQDPKPVDLQKLDQSTAVLADILPPMWKRMYDHLIAVEFTETQAMDILKAYIMSANVKYG